MNKFVIKREDDKYYRFTLQQHNWTVRIENADFFNTYFAAQNLIDDILDDRAKPVGVLLLVEEL